MIRKRLQMVRETLGLSKAAFGKKIGVSGQYMGMLESGRNQKPSENLVMRAIQEYELNQEWVETGKGTMFAKDTVRNNHINLIDLKNVRKIPILGSVPAGNPGVVPLTDLEIEDYIYYPSEGLPEDCFGARVQGDSMTPKLHEGDVVLYHWTTDLIDKDVVICRDEFGDHVMKRYRIKNGEAWLVSDNPAYPKIKPNGFQIVGKVIKAIREVEL